MTKINVQFFLFVYYYYYYYYHIPGGVLSKRLPATCRSPKPFPVSRCGWRSCLSVRSTVPWGATISRENRRRSDLSDRCAPHRSSRWPGAANRTLRAATPLEVRTFPAPCASSENGRYTIKWLVIIVNNVQRESTGKARK